MPTPSITARRTAQPIALFRIERKPPRTASEPPCVLLDTLDTFMDRRDTYCKEACNDRVPRVFFSSNSRLVNDHFLQLFSLSTHPFSAQSYVENNPPQTPKFPPNTGALAFIAVRAPILLSPYGLDDVRSESCGS
jgi:hypothetical protein